MTTSVVSFLAAFAASSVESVEALTIVLAVGLTRGWRAPLYGTAAALVALAVIVAVFGTVLGNRVPEGALKVVVGTLLLLFGLRWLRKAVLRSAGVIALHDEAREFAETRTRMAATGTRAGMDWVAFSTAFQGVLLEGLEVAFTILAVGANGRNLPAAALGGVAAAVAVAAIGVAVRHPLARVPENTLKFAVGIALASLGTFWAAEGAGTAWPADFVSLFVLAALFLAAAQGSVAVARGRSRAAM